MESGGQARMKQDLVHEQPAPPLPFRMTVYVQVNQNWYGNYHITQDKRYESDLLIRVSLLELRHPHGWRVCAWGNDDFGMERDYEPDQRDQALVLYQQIVSTQMPTQAQMHEWGMIRA